jgi:RloB-like protein
VTEPGYFNAFKHAARNQRVHVEVAKEFGVPRTVVEIAVRLRDDANDKAKRERDQNHRWDEVWGVFDVDEHPRLAEARRLAEEQHINLAVSNPCFELWALLHFQDQRAHVERGKAREALQGHLPGYDKALDFEKMHPGYGEAVRRAEELDKEAEIHGDPARNPTTRVYVLTESILQAGG